MTDAIDDVLRSLKAHPVLVDVGASAGAPADWERLKAQGIYIGFDPDWRDLPDATKSGFYRSTILPQAVVEGAGQAKAHFFLTRSPHCSSTLAPDSKALSDYLFAALFDVEGEAVVAATTLGAALATLGLAGIDWLKLDTQGTDLRLIETLPAQTQARLLAVDVEPGLAAAYVGEDTFVETHAAMGRLGFWLSNLRLDGTVRLRPATLAALQARARTLNARTVEAAVRRSPVWVEARYLRTVDSMRANGADARGYALLWAFALIDGQAGFALDVAAAYEELFGQDDIGARLWAEPLRQIGRPSARRLTARARGWLYALVPAGLRRKVKRRLA